jgi:hypothetical protein
MSATSRQQLPLVREFAICAQFAAHAVLLALMGIPAQYATMRSVDGVMVVEPSPVVQAAVERARKGVAT